MTAPFDLVGSTPQNAEVTPCAKCGARDRYESGRCRPCGKAYARARYHADKEAGKARANDWGNRNPEKRKAYQKRWREKNWERYKGYAREYWNRNKERDADKRKDWTLQYTYGITIDQYRTMEATQGGACAICKDLPGPDGRPLVVDHDHETERVRGLLCDRCNTGLGLLKDDPAVLAAAVDYLTNRSKGGPT